MSHWARLFRDVIELEDRQKKRELQKNLTEEALIKFFKSEFDKPDGESAFDSELNSKEKITEFLEKFEKFIDMEFLTKADQNE